MSQHAKPKVAVLMGGRSGEHEVSLQSGRAILEALDPQRYETIPIGIDKNGEWHLLGIEDPLENPTDPKRIRIHTSGVKVISVPVPGRPWIRIESGEHAPWPRPDVVFPVLHGTFGEDGTIQGLLELMEIPYVGAGVLGSSVGMDKDLMKRLFKDAGLAVGDFTCVREPEWKADRDGVIARIAKRFELPVYVKPANLGSSVGISRVSAKSDLAAAIQDAFRYDRKILVEQGIHGREIEVSVLGNDEPQASVPGEIVPRDGFYSYAAKYLDQDGARLLVPAELPEDTIAALQRCAVDAFRAVSCEGMARVDFFLEQGTGRVLINEINTIPGFTRISMYPKLWEASGVPFSELVDRLVSLALERHDSKKRLLREYSPGP